MGKIVKSNQPCLSCDSSDARQIYEDGSSFCFSCHTWFGVKDRIPSLKKKKTHNFKTPTVAEIDTYTSRGFEERKITKTVASFYGVKVSYNEDGEIDAHYYPYSDRAYQMRYLPKNFLWIGHKPDMLFGMDKFAGAGRKLIICEGAMDCLSVAQASYSKYQKFYPIVSVVSSSDLKGLLDKRDWVRSFQEVIVCFDEDKSGYKAQAEAIKIIGLRKVKITKLHKNDANDILVEQGPERLMQCIYDASPYIPSGILTKESLWERLEAYNDIKSVPYPPCLDGLNTKIKGLRFGEITLFVSGTGSGKSTMFREIMLHILSTTGESIGIVSLEESPEETARKLSGMIIKRNPAHEEIPLKDLKVGFDVVFNENRSMILDHGGDLQDDTILDKIEYMCLAGYKYIFIDHITILVAEGVENTTGNEAQDKVMSMLLKMVKKYDVWIGLISHLRKVGSGQGISFEQGKLPTMDDIRGSGSVKQISFDIVAFARKMNAEDPTVANRMKMEVLKARTCGLTGPVPGAFYDINTGRLMHIDQAPQEEDFDIEEKTETIETKRSEYE